MKLGVSMYSYVRAVRAGEMDLRGFIHEAKRIGADGVELLDFFYKDADTERHMAKETLAEVGLSCGVFSVAQNFAKATAEEREVQLTKILFGIGEAVFFDAKVVRVFAGDVSPGIEFDQARAWIIEGLAKAADVARERGVKLALENHGKLAGRGDQVRGIIDDVRQKCGHDALGANPDTGNFQLVGQESHEAIEQVVEYAYMVHFKDFSPAPANHEGYTFEALDGTKFIGTIIGEGDVDLAKCLAALKKAGFDGWVNLEYEGEGGPNVDEVEQSFRNARRFIDAC
jgi:sugar phosphate isomerase/epimerase